MEKKEELVMNLFKIGAVKFGNFILKSGIESPIYFDLRVITGDPTFMEKVADTMWNNFEIKSDFDQICGVPYTALPISTIISMKQKIPMIVRRKEVKNYGTKRILEGMFSKGDKCIIIEDVIVSGASVLETVQILRNEGLQVSDVIVFIDRCQGGQQNLTDNGMNVTSILSMDEILTTLLKKGEITSDTVEKVKKFLAENSNVKVKGEKAPRVPVVFRSLDSEKNKVKVKLLSIMKEKSTNLCVAADVTTCNELLSIADMVGPHICVLKTHIDILEDFNPKIIEALKQNAIKHKYLIMEDRKFADIGKTVIDQYRYGMYKIMDFADIVTVHGLPGKAVINALTDVAGQDKACVLVAELSSEGNLCTETYAQSCIQMRKNSDFVIGFVSQNRYNCSDDDIMMVPGVSWSHNTDNLGQRYKSPKSATERGADIIIVGRAITKAQDVRKAAQTYHKTCFAELSSFSNL